MTTSTKTRKMISPNWHLSTCGQATKDIAMVSEYDVVRSTISENNEYQPATVCAPLVLRSLLMRSITKFMRSCASTTSSVKSSNILPK